MNVCLKAVLALAMVGSVSVAGVQDKGESLRWPALFELKDYLVRPVEVHAAYPAGGGAWTFMLGSWPSI